MSNRFEQGFTLIELAIVMVIVGLLAGGGLQLTRSLSEQNQRTQSAKDLELAILTLNQYARLNGHLPWADDDDDGEADSGITQGTLPYLTLGIAPLDSYQRPLSYAVNTALNQTRNQTCNALSQGLAGAPEMVEVDGSTTAFSVAAVIISSGPRDADQNGSVFDDITGDHTGNNATGSPNYIRSPPQEGFDDIVRYISTSELFEAGNCSATLETWNATITNNSLNTIYAYDTTRSTCLAKVEMGESLDIQILRGDSIEIRDDIQYSASTHIVSTPDGPFSVVEDTQITIP